MLREQGKGDLAREILYYKELDRPVIDLSSLLWRVVGFTIGYGQYPIWAAYWLGGWALLGWFLFAWGKRTERMVQTNHYVSMVDPDFRPGVYSIDLLIPLLRLHQEDYWLPCSSSILSLYLPFHIIAGWILTYLLIAGFSGLIG